MSDLTKEPLPDFIIIDDDNINNMLCTMIIKNAIPGAGVVAFSDPLDGVAYLTLKCSDAGIGELILFLDINMPLMSGWEALEELNDCHQRLSDRLRIYMVSSSLDPRDKECAASNGLVKGFFEKPVTVSNIRSIIQEVVTNEVS